jgi:hypothetical protein
MSLSGSRYGCISDGVTSSFFTICTFVLAQRTPLNAAFWIVGLDRAFEDRRIVLPNRSEEAMLNVSKIEIETKAEVGIGRFC